MEMKWYTVYTLSNQEKKVAANLERKKITYFCPANSITNKDIKSQKNNYFGGYVFVKVLESQISELKEIKGVKHLLYWMQQPATINEFEINLIKRFLNDHTDVRLEKKDVGFNAIANSDNTAKENGAKLININGNTQIKVALPSLGYIMIAEKAAVPLAATANIASHSKLSSIYSKLNTIYRVAR